MVGGAMTPWKAIGIGCLILVLSVGASIWEGTVPERIFSVGRVPVLDFATLQRRDTPNQYLMCQNELCTAYIDDLPAVYAATVAEVRSAWEEVLEREPRVRELRRDLQGTQIDYVQRTPIMRFPDLITIRFIPVDETRTTIAIYSRSVYGQGDFGVNKARIRDWVGKLNLKLKLG